MPDPVPVPTPTRLSIVRFIFTYIRTKPVSTTWKYATTEEERMIRMLNEFNL